MNKRFLWNFELSLAQGLPSPLYLPHPLESLRWEARYFWPEKDIIVLDGMDESLFDLTQFKIKHHDDTYLIANASDYNIKRRREALVYKPQLDCKDGIFAYAKKLKLNSITGDTLLPGHPPIRADELQEQLTFSRSVHIDKIALSRRMPCEPPLKIEYSRLRIGAKIFFSLCIEGYSFALVQAFSLFIVKKAPEQNYVQFLKSQEMA